MKKLMKEWVRQTYPQKADKIIKWSLSEKKIRQAGIELKDHEIFVRYKWGYYGSNYGRLISTKYDRMTLREETQDGTGHVCYVITRPAPRRKGKIVGEPQREVFGGQWIVGELFLPNYWPKCTRRQLEVHHLDKNPANNKWTNLVLIPGWLHTYAEFVDSYWLLADGRFIKKMPYEITDTTGLTLEEVIYPLRRQCDFVMDMSGHRLEVYRIRNHEIGFELNDVNFRKTFSKRGKHAAKFIDYEKRKRK